MKTRSETWADDGTQAPARHNVLIATVFLLSAGLSADRATIPADGATIATINWAGRLGAPGASVTVSVNGTSQSLATTRDATTGLDAVDFEVTAAQTGPIEIIANGVDTLIIQAV